MLPRVCKFIVLVAVATIGFTQPAQAFMFFTKNAYCSPIEGIIQLDGKPLSGLLVRRVVKNDGLKNGRVENEAVTDEQGRFKFQEVSNRTFVQPNLFAAAILISQEISVSYEGKHINIWDYTKGDFEPYSEIANHERSLRLNCDLAKIIYSPSVEGLPPYLVCDSNRR